MTLQERFEAALLLEGETPVSYLRSSRYVRFTRKAGGYYFLGRAGALRQGVSITGSSPTPTKRRRELLSLFA